MEDIINELKNMLVEAKAKVEVITELLERFRPTDVQEIEEPFSEVQPVTDNTF